MRSWAWVELQRGLLDFDFGHPAAALAHYRRADAAYPGWCLVEEHVAEALGRLGRQDEAIALYRRILEKKRSPEFLAALAALLEPADPLEARALDREAVRTLRSAKRALSRGRARPLTSSTASTRGAADPALLEMAQRNAALRPNGDARLLLARAYAEARPAAEAARRELGGDPRHPVAAAGARRAARPSWEKAPIAGRAKNGKIGLSRESPA